MLEYEPPRRLSYTFLPQHDEFFSETHASRVLLELEQQRDQVKLTVIHDDFAEGSRVFESISRGWPLVLSSLKSYLESNRVLWAPWYEKEAAAS